MSSPMEQMLEKLRAEAARMAGRVQQSVDDAIEALVRGDADLAQHVVDVDEEIDAAELLVEKRAIDLLSLYRPAAGEFRLGIMVVKVNNELERIADCAANVAERVAPLLHDAEKTDEPYRIPTELHELANVVADLVRRTVRAFNFGDVAIAEAVMRDDDHADALYAQVLQDTLSDLRSTPSHGDRDMAYVMVAKNLERIGDHCTNIAEDIVYIQKGEVVRHRHTA